MLAFAQDGTAIGVKREAFGWEGEGEIGRVIDRDLGYLRPHLGGEHIARDNLVADFFIEISAQQTLLLDGQIPRQFELLVIPGIDGRRELFQAGVDFALEAFDEPQSRIYIHCAAGVHRAPMMTLAILRVLGWPLQDAKDLIQQRRYVVDFAECYVESVENFVKV